ncbi:MAG: sigma-70 family RNA polymerase sigma factor [Deltaproteobacteria bacterium]
MKYLAAGGIITTVPDITEPAAGTASPPRPDASAVYTEHAEFVWKGLFRLGVRESDLEDMVQEVFMVVHRRISSFDGSSRMTTWLFGIAMRVAAGYHRRAHRRRFAHRLRRGGRAHATAWRCTLAA